MLHEMGFLTYLSTFHVHYIKKDWTCINNNTAELPQLVQAKRFCYISLKIPAVGNFYILMKLVDFEFTYCLPWWGPRV